ncbi:4-hydroxy-3-methylbut-2-en-1-yl diphosphate synthase, partial [Bacillus cereus]|nr:4-hydroxy-3-methylbut-2-en-1-yl diphosphate synthase [Bacillus cereus]
MSEAVSLGMPEVRNVFPRKKTRKVRLGNLWVGGDAPVTVQSMCTTKTTDIGGTLQQIAELTAAGCDIVRVACPSADDAEALPI